MTSRPSTLPGPEVAPGRSLPNWVHVVTWLVIAGPAIYQLVLLAIAIGGRIGYPYDLEWMEGGMLHHAQRIRDGAGIYVPPSIDFIPYLYTPLYPGVVAVVGGVFGISYTVGRTISVLSLIGIGVIAAVHIPNKRHEHARRGPAWAGVALGLGLFAAAYPIADGWYDLVRADTLFLMLITFGIAVLPRWCTTRTGRAGHLQVAAAGAVLAIAFFCKQTGIVYVGLGGVFVLVLAWRRLPAYVAAAGVVGLGGTWLLQTTSGGWFWTYVFEVHQAHDFSMDRFWKSFEFILWRTDHFPLIGAPITIVVLVSLAFVVATWRRFKLLPPQARPLLTWSAAFAVSVVVGAIGWGTEFAHFNAYIPAQLHGALAAGAAIPAVYGCARLWWPDDVSHPPGRAPGELVHLAVAVIVAVPLAITCVTASWSPSKFTPTDADVAAGDRLIDRIRQLPGRVWMPSHPWYLELAGKMARVHRMGIKDVTTRQNRKVAGLEKALDAHGFSAIVLDNVDLHNRERLPALYRNYRPAFRLPADERPHVYTGARVIPDQIWVPSTPASPPDGVHVVFDFERATWGPWQHEGAAWGNGPVEQALPGQDLVGGATGRRFADSMHAGDASTGRAISPAFALDGSKLSVRLGGGDDAKRLRVELYTEDSRAPLDVIGVAAPGGDNMQMAAIEIPKDKRGKQAHLVLVDDSPTGHLVVDDVWLWP